MWFPQFCLITAKIWSDGRTSVRAPCYSSVLFRKQRKIHPQVGGVGSTQKTQKRSPAPSILAPLLLLLGLPCVNWACQEGSLFYLRSSLWSSDLPLFYFHGLSPALSFSHCHSGLIFPILTAECIHTYISFWVNFSEEPWMMQVWCWLWIFIYSLYYTEVFSFYS